MKSLREVTAVACLVLVAFLWDALAPPVRANPVVRWIHSAESRAAQAFRKSDWGKTVGWELVDIHVGPEASRVQGNYRFNMERLEKVPGDSPDEPDKYRIAIPIYVPADWTNPIRIVTSTDMRFRPGRKLSQRVERLLNKIYAIKQSYDKRTPLLPPIEGQFRSRPGFPLVVVYSSSGLCVPCSVPVLPAMTLEEVTDSGRLVYHQRSRLSVLPRVDSLVNAPLLVDDVIQLAVPPEEMHALQRLRDAWTALKADVEPLEAELMRLQDSMSPRLLTENVPVVAALDEVCPEGMRAVWFAVDVGREYLEESISIFYNQQHLVKGGHRFALYTPLLPISAANVESYTDEQRAYHKEAFRIRVTPYRDTHARLVSKHTVAPQLARRGPGFPFLPVEYTAILVNPVDGETVTVEVTDLDGKTDCVQLYDAPPWKPDVSHEKAFYEFDDVRSLIDWTAGLLPAPATPETGPRARLAEVIP